MTRSQADADELARDIEGCRASAVRLHAGVGSLTDLDPRRPSLLPAWSVGHVLTHLARNGDSVLRRLRAAERGHVVPQYEGGAAGRAREIEEGASRSARDIVADLVAVDRAVHEAFGSVDTAVWSRPVLRGDGSQGSAGHLVHSRWREVEIHHVDLGLGYGCDDWPQALVRRWLPTLLTALPERTDPQALAAWALGRGAAPALAPWG